MKHRALSTIAFWVMAACIITLGLPAAQAQNSDFNTNILSSNPFSAQTEEFLPVDEAYQLSVRQTETSIIAEWVIADAYFLYGEQFRFVIDGKTVEAERPAGEVSYDAIFEKDVEKYYVFVQATINKARLPNGKTQLADNNNALAITYQGCADAGLCYPPATKLFSINLQTLTTVAQTSNAPQTQTETAKTSSTFSASTAIFMLLIAVLGGMILNLMPCVFPVLSIKALSFANNTNDRSRIAHGWSYTLGCVVSFVAMATVLLIIKDTGKAVGWGFQLQSPGVISFLTLLFFIMGLSLSGLLTIGNHWMGIGQSLTQGQGHKQSFFTGVLAAIVASPCTAPFMATALGYALTQSSIVALIIFAGLGLGMALPFLILSYLPQLARLLPAPGAWMETFKQAVAFPLYLTCVWLLWVLSQQIGNDGMVVVMMGAITIVFACWLSQKKPSLNTINTFIMILTVAGVAWHNQQQPTVERTTDKRFWESYSTERLNALRAQNQRVFVNLTADWCITCKVNEKLVFTPDTLEKMKNKHIYLLEGDWTNYNAEITALLDEYGRGGVPLYLLFPANEAEKALVLPQILQKKMFLGLIEEL